tara:strand:+ start:190 stop:1050 length:861 start_codon:yes stop_codon:yes gene_type:complete
MRRKIDNRSVILIILIATFTLLSYVFDQLVIRNEDKLRTQDIKYQNLYTERKSLESLSTQILNYSTDIYMQSTDRLENRNIWLKQYILLNNKDLQDNNFRENFKNEIDLSNFFKNQIIEYFKDCLKMSGLAEMELSGMFAYYQRILPEFKNWYSDGTHYSNNYTNWKMVFNDNLNVFNKKDYDYYMKANENSNYDSFKLKNWIDLINFGNLVLKNILYIQYKIADDNIKVSKKISEIETQMNEILTEIKKTSAFKNYYILSSIFSQILSLLILLILFRHLLLNIKK